MIPVKMDPIRDMLNVQDNMSRLFPFRWGIDDSNGAWSPVVDVYEKDDCLLVKAEIPGVRSEDIDVNVDNGKLTIRGERRADNEIKEDNVYRRERSYGTFVRTFTLPTGVDHASIQAKYHDGILEVSLPKKEEARPRRIEIATS